MDAEPQTFTNTQVRVDSLPDFRRVELNPVVRNFFAHALITTAGFWLVLSLVSLVAPRLPFVSLDFGIWPTLVLLGLTVWFSLIAWLGASRRGWALREHDLIYRSGVIWRKTVIVPFARIQHVETTSGPLERWLKLMRVKCFTAGGMMADLSVEGLDEESARQVRQYLLEQIRDDVAHAGQSGDGQRGASVESD
jgi:uncharacterized protein